MILTSALVAEIVLIGFEVGISVLMTVLVCGLIWNIIKIW